VRLGIDVRYLSHGLLGGIHSYVAQLVPALVEQAAGPIFLYADTKRPFELRDLPARVVVRRLPWRSPLSSVQLDLTLWRAMAADRVELAHFPANYGFGPPGATTVLTVHDALNLLPLPHLLRGAIRGQGRLAPRTAALTCYLHLLTQAAVRRAGWLLTVSEHARQQIARQSGVDPRRIVAIPHAPGADAAPTEDAGRRAALRQRYRLPDRFLLADGLKNPELLVQAWRRLPAELRQERQIVFFARQTALLPAVHQAVAEGEARLLIRPPRDDLIGLYGLAEAFLFPSWIEGFGLPVLEAMACGTPVIASDRGSIPEVAGGAALLADAEQPAQFAGQIERLLRSAALRSSLRERGLQRAAQFSWAASARRTLEAYSLAAGRAS
jgi:glycosyltransferase involved in cell wall biosynthesis